VATCIFTEKDLLTLRAGLNDVLHQYREMMEKYLSFANIHVSSYEFIVHGFLRRLGTLQQCIKNVFSLYEPARSDRPPREVCVDLGINLQSFVFNIFGCLDNLAGTWVCEKALTNAKGKPLTRNQISFRRDVIFNTYSTEFQKYLTNLEDWFEYLDNFRHALAHQVPLYVPPYMFDPADEEEHHKLALEQRNLLIQGNIAKYDLLLNKQESLGRFYPVMSCSPGSKGTVRFHERVLSDWNTIMEISEKFLSQTNW
jgi:hypothetical protein